MLKYRTQLVLSVLCAFAFVQDVEAKPKLRGVSVIANGTDAKLEVTGKDGVYDKISDAHLDFAVTVKARVKGLPLSRDIWEAFLTIPSPAGTRASATGNTSSTVNLLAENHKPRKIDKTVTVQLPVWKLGDHRKRIIDACNERGPAQLDREQHNILPIKFTVGANLTRGASGFGMDSLTYKSNQTTMIFPIICRPIDPPVASQDVSFDQGQFKVTDIELFRSTYGYNHNANAGTKCQKLKVLTRIKTNQSGSVKIRLWKKIGSAPLASQETVWAATHDGQGYYSAEHTEIITVNEPTFVQVKAEELVSTIGKSTSWKSINLQCTSSGGGGFTVGSSDQDTAPPKPPLKITPQLSLNDLTGKKSCPREGRAIIAFKTNRPDPVPFKFRCSFGTSVEGVAKTAPHSEGGWIAPAIANFTIDKTKRYHCRLFALDTDSGKAIVSVAAERNFDCANRVIEPHSGGLVSGQHTTSGSTTGIQVTSVPTCRMQWKTSCKRVPERKCQKTFKTECKRVPKSECRVVKTKTCRRVPTTKCKTQVTRNCKRVPKVECRMVRGKRICKRTMTTRCQPQRKRVCSRTFERKCTFGTKRECKRKMTRVCSRVPSTSCKTTWRKTCARQRVRVCG